MSRDLSDSDYYVSQGGQIPIKWTAPEVIKIFYFTASKLKLLYVGCSFQEVLHSQ